MRRFSCNDVGMIDPESKSVQLAGGNGPGEIRSLSVEFVLPDQGRFGRDKHVPYREASHAAVEYWKDNEQVEQTVLLSSAQTLIDQAERDADAQRARAEAAAAAEAAIVADVQQKLANLTCPVCGRSEFKEEVSREATDGGGSTFRMKLLICQRCDYVMHFSLGRSMFNPSRSNAAMQLGGMNQMGSGMPPMGGGAASRPRRPRTAGCWSRGTRRCRR